MSSQNEAEIPELTPDCERCVALCCVALPFDKSEWFAYDKSAGEPCRHLNDDNRCGIHDRLHESGFGGCARFNCFGAGQRVTQYIFGGQDWRNDKRIALEMYEAFHKLRQVHELLAMLLAAEKLPLSRQDKARITELRSPLLPVIPWRKGDLQRLDVGSAKSDVQLFLAGLKDTPGLRD